MSCCQWSLGQRVQVTGGVWRGKEGVIERFHHSPSPDVYVPKRPAHSCIAWVRWGEGDGYANWIGVEHLQGFYKSGDDQERSGESC